MATAGTGFPGIRKLKKKSFVVIKAPPGETFPAATKVDKVERLGASAMTFDISKQELDPAANPIRILLSIKGTKRDPVPTKSIVPLLDLPDPGNLTITLVNQGATIEPVVTVPVVFVDDFDP